MADTLLSEALLLSAQILENRAEYNDSAVLLARAVGELKTMVDDLEEYNESIEVEICNMRWRGDL